MKTNYRKLQLLIRFGIINPDDFYTIRFDDDDIIAQAYYSSGLALKYKSWSYNLDGTNGFILFKKKNITIVLT